MRIGCLNYNSSTRAALNMKQVPLWVVLGKTSPWDNELSPDSPLPGTSTIVEPVVAIKVTNASMAVSVSEAQFNALDPSIRVSIVIGGNLFYLQLVLDANAYSSLATYLYLQVLYDPVILGMPPFSSFRSYYLVSNLVPTAGNENAVWLPPQDVSSYGLIEYQNNGTAISGDHSISIPIVLLYS